MTVIGRVLAEYGRKSKGIARTFYTGFWGLGLQRVQQVGFG
jgi:hypothetical protein